jgi:hypothetical protein
MSDKDEKPVADRRRLNTSGYPGRSPRGFGAFVTSGVRDPIPRSWTTLVRQMYVDVSTPNGIVEGSETNGVR